MGTGDFGPLAHNDPTNDGPDNASDGIVDANDCDDDNDGVANNCPNVANAGNDCSTVANPGQEDFDADTIGDAYDSDIDGDGAPNDDDVNETAIVGGNVAASDCHTGVGNLVLANGETIADQLARSGQPTTASASPPCPIWRAAGRRLASSPAEAGVRSPFAARPTPARRASKAEQPKPR